MLSDDAMLLVILAAGMFWSIRFKKLTAGAAITGAVIALFVFMGTGYTGVAMMSTFFVLGSLVTSWKIKTKQQLGLAEGNRGTRTASQVIANAGVPAILGIFIYFFPLHKDVFGLMMGAAFASATADTLSSELGNLYGGKFYNIITLKKDQRGLDGVISLEGTLFGVAGSFFVGVIFYIGLKASLNSLFVIVIAGTAGNFADSIIGATAERKRLVGNNTVNLLNTMIAALVSLVIYIF